jgi:hypothetical protein
VTSGPAAAAARAAGGQARASRGEGPAKDRRAADDELWAQAARQHAAAKARREARSTGAPGAPAASREPYRPWFADSAGDEPWLSAGGTGEPWFAEGGAKRAERPERPEREDLP